MDPVALEGYCQGAVLNQSDVHGQMAVGEEALHLISVDRESSVFPGFESSDQVVDVLTGLYKCCRCFSAALSGPAVDRDGAVLGDGCLDKS